MKYYPRYIPDNWSRASLFSSIIIMLSSLRTKIFGLVFWVSLKKVHFACVCCNQAILSSPNLTTTSVLWPAVRLLVTEGLRGLLTLRIIIHFKSWRRLEVRVFTSLGQKASSGLCCCVITSINIYSRFRTTVEWKKLPWCSFTLPVLWQLHVRPRTLNRQRDRVLMWCTCCRSSPWRAVAWLFLSHGPPLLWRVYLLRTDGVHIRRSTAGTTALSPWTQNGY